MAYAEGAPHLHEAKVKPKAWTDGLNLKLWGAEGPEDSTKNIYIKELVSAFMYTKKYWFIKNWVILVLFKGPEHSTKKNLK